MSTTAIISEWGTLENTFEKQFELRYFEMNRFGEATPAMILTLLEETAAEHCYSIGQSLYDLEKQHIGWVLLSGVIQMERYPLYKERITIRTWLSQYSLIKGFRENIIMDAEGNVIGRAKGLWLFFDITKRRPVPIFESIHAKWKHNEEVCIDHDICIKLSPVEALNPGIEFRVRKSDMDSNNHVNNISYLHWLMESVPQEMLDHYFLYQIDGRFISEAQYGDTILTFIEKGNIPHSFSHTIRTKSNNRVCATANTIWKPKN
jgi:acyl-ACP thioesterase